MPLHHNTAAGYESFQRLLGEVDKKKRIVVLFTGNKNLSTGRSWCPDCVVAEPIVSAVVDEPEVAELDIHYITVFVGNREVWRDPAAGFRTDPKLKLTSIPTLLEYGKKSKRLVEAQVANKALVKSFFTDED